MNENTTSLKSNRASQGKLKVLSLFSGCGGMDLGFEGGFDVLTKSINANIHPEWIGNRHESRRWTKLPETRFETIFANDIVRSARASWVPYFSGRGRSEAIFHRASIVDLVKEHSENGGVFPQADVVTGGFPCQDFSVAGKRKGFNSHKGHYGSLLEEFDDPTEENRGKLYVWMKRVVEVVRPKVFVAENVKGLVSLADAKNIIEKDFRNIGTGYTVVDAKVLSAPMFGIPQSRERVFFIGFKTACLTEKARKALTARCITADYDPYPPPTHGAQELTNGGDLLPLVSVGDCLGDLPEPTLSTDPSHKAYSKAKWYGTHCQGQTEVDMDGIGPTIRSEHHGNIEFRRLSLEHGGKRLAELRRGLPERRLSVRECARIQTFPDDFEFVRKESVLGTDYRLSATDGYKLVGNAVPPLLAFHIAWRLQELWPTLFDEEKL